MASRDTDNPWRRFAWPALLFLTALALYAPTLSYDLTYDDGVLVAGRSAELDLLNGGWLRNPARIVRTLSFAVDGWIFGEPPHGRHVQNVLLHAIAGLLLFAVGRRLAGSSRIAGVAALLFILHPVQVETVANVSNRKESLCLVFLLLGFLLYLRARTGTAESGWIRMAALIGALLAWILALLSKEVAIGIPVAVAAYEGWMRSDRLRRHPRPVAASAVLVIALAVGFTLFLDGRDLAGIRTLGGYTGEMSAASAVLTVGESFWRSVALLIWPFGQSPHHVVDLRTGIDALAILGWLAIAGLLAIAPFLARRAPLAVFGLVWFLAFLLPVSNIIPVGYFVAERYLYVPSAGIFLTVAMLCAGAGAWLTQRLGRPRATALSWVTLLLVAALLATKTASYRNVWRDDGTLWSYELQRHSGSLEGHLGLATFEYDKGRHDRALELFDRALQLSPDSGAALFGRANCLAFLGRTDEAIAAYDRALTEHPPTSEVLNNRGNMYLRKRQFRRAIEDYDRAVRIDPSHADPLNNRGTAHFALGETELAIRDFEAAIAANPRYRRAYANLGRLYEQLGDDDRARDYRERAERLAEVETR